MSVDVVNLPTAKELRELLVGLLGREVTVEPSPMLVPGPTVPCSVGVYVDDHLVVRGVIICDLPFSAWAGAALALLPTGLAQAAIIESSLEVRLVENLYELLNISASLFNNDDSPHLRLLTLHDAGQPLDPAVRMHCFYLGRRADLTVDIAGYGQGRLSIVLVT